MKSLKRLLCLVLALIIIIGVFVIVPISANAVTSGDYTYKKLTDKTAMITGYNGDSSKVFIPSKIDKLKVVCIGKEAFGNCRVKRLWIPDTVKEIKSCAFAWCQKLSKVKIGKSVTTIGSYAFGETSLQYVNLPISLKKLHCDAFESCRKIKKFNISPKNKYFFTKSGVLFDKKKKAMLIYPPKKTSKSYTVPNNIKSIKTSADNDNKYLKSITFGKKVNELSSGSFAFYTKLKTVKFKCAIKKISAYCFQGCYSLKNVEIKKGSKITFYRITKASGQMTATQYKSSNSKVLPVKTTKPTICWENEKLFILKAKNRGEAVISVTEGPYNNGKWLTTPTTRKVNVKVK